MNDRPVSRVRQLLDVLHGSRWSWCIPLLLAAAVYMLFLIFGTDESKIFLLIASPVMSGIAFGGVYGLVRFQTKNPGCPETFLNAGMLLLSAVFGCSALGLLTSFLRSMPYGYTIMLPVAMCVWSAISLAHGKRMND